MAEDTEINPEDYDKWRKAGKIAAQALKFGADLIKPGAKLLDVSDKIDAKIKELGAEPAFPSQISPNHIAAHNCADPDDSFVFKDEVCCLDVGVHIDGCIGDNATTVDLSKNNAELVKASRDALNNAVKIIQIGTTLGEIGKTIQQTIETLGFRPISNLSGHALLPYNIHAPPQIPNIDNNDPTKLEKGMIIAIEPFATNGQGSIYETDKANIFAVINKRPVRSMISRQVLKEIDKLNGLPFTTRWLTTKFPLFKVNFALRELLKAGIIKDYPPLPDKAKGLVSQAEHTLLIEDKVEILTD